MNNPLRVLIVDDTPDIRMLLTVVLGSMDGFEPVGEAEDGAEAVRMAAELKPDAVLLDLAMPVMDGLQAAPEIRKCSPETRIIILSGFSKDRLGDDAIAAGADAYIEKGTSPKLIGEKLREVCSTPRDPGNGPSGGGDSGQGADTGPAGDGVELWKRRIAMVRSGISIRTPALRWV